MSNDRWAEPTIDPMPGVLSRMAASIARRRAPPPETEKEIPVVKTNFNENAVTVVPAREMLMRALTHHRQTMIDELQSADPNVPAERLYRRHREHLTAIQSFQFALDVLGGYVNLAGEPVAAQPLEGLDGQLQTELADQLIEQINQDGEEPPHIPLKGSAS